MNNTWHVLKNLTGSSDTKEISAEAAVPPESKWFDGHFPGNPILPGIAQLALVSDALREFAHGRGDDMPVVGISRVRFRQFIRPNDSIQVSASPDKDDPSLFKFRIRVNGQLACSGQMATERRNS
jgi:3-hydroxymyristoyl/3-hydroxydecanoyl-(acyl carrier protein) dehydratase